MRTFHSKPAAAALAALFALTTPAGAAPACGLSFNGTSAYVNTSTGVIPGAGDFTVEIWAACPTAPSTYKEILSQGSSGNALYIGTDTANNIRLGDTWTATGVAFPVGGWHHFAVVKSSTNTIFYLDGTNWLSRGSAIANPAPSSSLQFGCQYAGIGEYWPGSVGDVRVWSRALADAEISANLTRQLTGSEANLVANWQFREGSGTTCTSIGPIPVAGTLINGPVWIVPPVVALGTTNLTEGPVAGSSSVVLGIRPAGGSWTATASDSWLHVTTASGSGSTNVLFTFDANPGATRTGTLSVAGQTVTVTQAGAGYVAVSSLTDLNTNTTTSMPCEAVDGAGNVYYANDNNTVLRWNVADGSLTTLVSSGLNSPGGLAVDGAGNVYIADSRHNAIKRWNAANGTVTTVVTNGLNFPVGVAADSAGNLYIADCTNNALKRWNAASNTMTTLDTTLNQPRGIAMDAAGNVYIADAGSKAVKEWIAATGKVKTLFSVSGVGPTFFPGVAVDGRGNVYVTDYYDGLIEEKNASGGALTTLLKGNSVIHPQAVAADGAGNVYVGGSAGGGGEGSESDIVLAELPQAFVNTTAETEMNVAGGDVLPAVLPDMENLAGAFAPQSDQSWLTITGATNGVVCFSFTANTTTVPRTANITVLGQSIPIAQSAGPLPPAIANWSFNASNQFQFHFTGSTNTAYIVLSATNLALPLSNWPPLNPVIETSPGQYQFTDTNAPADPQRFYLLRWP